MLFFMSCGSVPKMTYSGKTSMNYDQAVKEKKNVLFYFPDSFNEYEAQIKSEDIEVLDFYILGISFLPIYKNLNVFLESGGFILLEDIPQGNKKMEIQLFYSNMKRSKASFGESGRYFSRKLKKVGVDFVLNVGIGPNDILIQKPKKVYVQQAINIGELILGKEKVNSSKNKKKDKTSFQSLEELMSEYNAFVDKAHNK